MISFEHRVLRQNYERQRQNTLDIADSTLTNLDMTYRARREGLVAEYNAQVRAGQNPEARTTVREIIALDAKYSEARTLVETGARKELLEQDRKYELRRLALAVNAEIFRFEFLKDPSGAMQLLSDLIQIPVRFQMRSDGNVDMFVQQQSGEFFLRDTYSSAKIIEMLRREAAQRARILQSSLQE